MSKCSRSTSSVVLVLSGPTQDNDVIDGYKVFYSTSRNNTPESWVRTRSFDVDFRSSSRQNSTLFSCMSCNSAQISEGRKVGDHLDVRTFAGHGRLQNARWSAQVRPRSDERQRHLSDARQPTQWNNILLQCHRVQRKRWEWDVWRHTVPHPVVVTDYIAWSVHHQLMFLFDHTIKYKNSLCPHLHMPSL